MKKIEKTTLILLPRSNHAKCPIYEHEGKYYIKPNKPNTQQYKPFWLDGQEWSEVEKLGDYWHLK